ncbi:MAG: NAD(P)H:quinone oxidoreductase [Thermoleophilia bacterium]|nr:NAD(P)H:quinone oxidoreductase [Thermoleophilia bacterium]
MARIAVIYYSSTGNVHRLAHAVAEGAEAAGAEVRLRHVVETAPEEAIAQNADWAAHRAEMDDDPVASLDDLEWCDGYIFGTPTRFGNVSAQLKQFMDTTGPLWGAGKLADKVAAGFTSSQNAHGGQESTLLALYNTMHHWGAIIAAPGYTDPRVFEGGGNPYGASSVDGTTEGELTSARYVGERVATIADRLAA